MSALFQRVHVPGENPMNIDTLRETCKGVVAVPGDAGFSELLHGNLWNRLIPDRTPQVLVRVNDEQDVIGRCTGAAGIILSRMPPPWRRGLRKSPDGVFFWYFDGLADARTV
jgi:hypothetical protein